MATKTKPPTRPKPFKPRPPSGKAGNYRAPVDTTGMDPEMQKTLGIIPKKRRR